jgi:peptidoglycan/LPS O-acetylase OafA/YrhL
MQCQLPACVDCHVESQVAPSQIKAQTDGATVPDVVAPPPHHPRFPLADGMRALAAIAVLLVHVWLFTGGFGGFTGSLPNRMLVRLDVAVAIFFLLSGFLLYRPMIAHRTGGGPAPGMRSFVRGRFLRIYPAYWVALTVLTVFPGLVGVFSDKWWVFYTMGDYFNPHFHLSVCPVNQQFKCGLPQSWTLAVEVTFYIALPFYAALSARLTRGRSVRNWMRTELCILAALAAISLILSGGALSLRNHTWFQFTFLGHMYWLALGMGLAVISTAYGIGPSQFPRPLRFAADHPTWCWAGAFGLYLLTAVLFYPAPFPVAPFTGFQAAALSLIQGGVALLLLIPVFFGNPNIGAPARLMRAPIMLWLGLVSYGLYLWQVTPETDLGFGNAHEGFAVVLIGTLLFALPCAAASYYLVERPLMKLKRFPITEWLERRRQGPEIPP